MISSRILKAPFYATALAILFGCAAQPSVDKRAREMVMAKMKADWPEKRAKKFAEHTPACYALSGDLEKRGESCKMAAGYAEACGDYIRLHDRACALGHEPACHCAEDPTRDSTPTHEGTLVGGEPCAFGAMFFGRSACRDTPVVVATQNPVCADAACFCLERRDKKACLEIAQAAPTVWATHRALARACEGKPIRECYSADELAQVGELKVSLSDVVAARECADAHVLPNAPCREGFNRVEAALAERVAQQHFEKSKAKVEWEAKLAERKRAQAEYQRKQQEQWEASADARREANERMFASGRIAPNPETQRRNQETVQAFKQLQAEVARGRVEADRKMAETNQFLRQAAAQAYAPPRTNNPSGSSGSRPSAGSSSSSASSSSSSFRPSPSTGSPMRRPSNDDDDRPSPRSSSGGSSPSSVSIGLPSTPTTRPSSPAEVKPASAATDELTQRDRDFREFCDYAHANYPIRSAPNEVAHADRLVPKLRKLAQLRSGERVTLAPEHQEFLTEVQAEAGRLHHDAKEMARVERDHHDNMPSPVTEVQRKFKALVFQTVTHEGVGELHRIDDVHRRDWGNPGTGKASIDRDADAVLKVKAMLGQIYRPKYEHPLATECKNRRAPEK